MTTTYVDLPDGYDVAAFLGEGDDPELVALAEEHVGTVTTFARSYTRGGGFTELSVAEDVAAVIRTATARLVTNPEQVRQEGIGGYSVSPGGFHGWTLVESVVLNRYRRRAQ